MKILVTGFEPFGGEKVNPSGKLLQLLKRSKIGAQVRTEILPVSYSKSIDRLKEIYSQETFDFVLHIGQAGGRSSINLERIALNLKNSKHPDNDGVVCKDEKIVEDGQLACITKTNVEKLAEKLTKKKIPTDVSYHAGLYICNEVYYYSLYSSETKGNPKEVLFVHIPYLPEQVLEKNLLPGYKHASMDLKLMFKAITTILEDYV